MIFDPEWEKKAKQREAEALVTSESEPAHGNWDFLKDVKVLERLLSIKEKMFLKMSERSKERKLRRGIA
jgi:hypothetical protein